MTKIITEQIQATSTSQVFQLPIANTPGALLTTDAQANISFTTAPTVTSLTSTGTIASPILQAPFIKSTPTSATFTLPTVNGAADSFLQNNGSGVLSFQNINISLSGTTDPTTATAASAGIVYANTKTGQYFVCMGARIVGGVTIYQWEGSNGTNIGIPQGQQAYTTPGTYSFIVPASIYSLSAVLVGGGGGGGYTWANSGGGGGALAYATFAVTPGETLTVTVGAGGVVNGSGQASSISRSATALFSAQGGTYSATSTRAAPVAGTVTCYGGQGGLCSTNGYGGGGGAGGYGATTTGSDAQGGDGSYGYSGAAAPNGGNGSSGAGGGGAGYQSSTYGFGGGGGVGLLGRGTSGAYGTPNSNSFYTNTGGFGGSGGDQGAGNSNTSQVINGTTYYSGSGGKFGGGGGGGGTSLSGGSGWCVGGSGGARIIWGLGRNYPAAANTGDVPIIA